MDIVSRGAIRSRHLHGIDRKSVVELAIELHEDIQEALEVTSCLLSDCKRVDAVIQAVDDYGTELPPGARAGLNNLQRQWTHKRVHLEGQLEAMRKFARRIETLANLQEGDD